MRSTSSHIINLILLKKTLHLKHLKAWVAEKTLHLKNLKGYAGFGPPILFKCLSLGLFLRAPSLRVGAISRALEALSKKSYLKHHTLDISVPVDDMQFFSENDKKTLFLQSTPSFNLGIQVILLAMTPKSSILLREMLERPPSGVSYAGASGRAPAIFLQQHALSVSHSLCACSPALIPL